MPAEDIHILEQSVTISLIPQSEFVRVDHADRERLDLLALLADMNRANTLATVKRAGSGHLGASLSAMDIVTWLYYHEMNTRTLGVDHPDRDIYFSSKGHDVPGLYSTLFSLGVLPKDKLLKLRRFGGLDGHPDIGVTGIEANSGSLGMGISKGKGMALAKRLQRRGGRVFVMTGDGELQEGQNYEGLASAAHHKVDNLIVIVDHNKLQSDKTVEAIMALGDLEHKLSTFGWHVARCDGHDYAALDRVFTEFRQIADKPKLLIADTIKGRGVSFMEHPFALEHNGGLYPWHAGAPDDEAFTAAHRELLLRIQDRLAALSLDPLVTEDVTPEDKPKSGVSPEYVVKAYGDRLEELGASRPDLVVLDADLAADCRVRGFEQHYPERFIEMGIAEQDMVSTAAGLASQGMLPVVNSFASFLASRANEQIYNAATEGRKIIYGCTYAGLIPAGPGKSHQSLRDISLFGALPNVIVMQPANAAETRMVVDYAVKEATESVAIRLAIGPSPRLIELPEDYRLTFGQGVTLREGTDAVLFAYGPIMLHEALRASEYLAEAGFGLRVIDLPWLNRIDPNWLIAALNDISDVYVIDDHAPVGGLGDALLDTLNRVGWLGADGKSRRFTKFAVEGFPACGTPAEALAFHQLSGDALATRIRSPH